MKFEVIDNEDGRYQFEDENGNLSKDSYYDIDDYSEGFAMVQEEKGGRYQYRDQEGNLSEDSYYIACPYYEGYAFVQKEKGGRYQYRDQEGNLSEDSYFIACSYSEGYAVVRKEEYGLYQFRDLEGNLSEDSYYEAMYYNKGFAKVRKEKDSPYQFRDMLGNVTNEETEIGKHYYEYYNNKVDLYDLSEECFKDPKFVKKIIEKEKLISETALFNAETEEEKAKVLEFAEKTAAYINDMIFIANEKEFDETEREKNNKIKIQSTEKTIINDIFSKI